MVSTMPLHFPGHNYCGPGTWDFSRVAVGDVDECCKTHDKQYGDADISTAAADEELTYCLQETQSASGSLIAGIIRGKTYIDKATGYASDSMLRRGEKRQHESKQQEAADKRAKITQESSSEKELYYDPRDADLRPVLMDDPGEPAVGPSGVISGVVIPGDTHANHGDTAGIRTLHFNRTLQHYIATDTDKFNTIDYAPLVEYKNDKYGKLRFNHAGCTVPYNYLNAAMTRAEIETHLMGATAWRVQSCGFKLTNVIPLTDTVNQVGGTVNTDLAINTRPWFVGYIDSKHNFFKQSHFMHKELPNSNMTMNIATSREMGMLRGIKQTRIVARNWLKHQTNLDGNSAASGIAMDNFMSIWNTDNLNYIYSGDTWQYAWHNKNPFWYNGMSFAHGHGEVCEGMPLNIWKAIPVEIGSNVMQTFNWVPNGRGISSSKHTGGTYEAANVSNSNQNTAIPGRSCLTQMPMEPSEAPPVAYIEIAPMLTASNEPTKSLWVCTIVYECTIQIETMSGNPQYAGWHVPRDDTHLTTDLWSRERTTLCQGPVGMRHYALNNHASGTNPCLMC